EIARSTNLWPVKRAPYPVSDRTECDVGTACQRGIKERGFDLGCENGGRGAIAFVAEGSPVQQRSEGEFSHSGSGCEVLHRLDPCPGVRVAMASAKFALCIENVTGEPEVRVGQPAGARAGIGQESESLVGVPGRVGHQAKPTG